MRMFGVWEISIKETAHPYSIAVHKYSYKLPPQNFANTRVAKIWLDALVECWKKDTGYKHAEVVGLNFSGITFVGTSDEGTDPVAFSKQLKIPA